MVQLFFKTSQITAREWERAYARIEDRLYWEIWRNSVDFYPPQYVNEKSRYRINDKRLLVYIELAATYSPTLRGAVPSAQ